MAGAAAANERVKAKGSGSERNTVNWKVVGVVDPIVVHRHGITQGTEAKREVYTHDRTVLGKRVVAAQKGQVERWQKVDIQRIINDE